MIDVKLKSQNNNAPYDSNAINLKFEKWFTMSQVVKIIANGMSEITLIKFLKDQNLIEKNNEPEQNFVTLGYLKYEVENIRDHSGRILFPQVTTVVSMKGIKFIQRLLKKMEEEMQSQKHKLINNGV